MKKLFVRAGLMCEFEPVSTGYIGAALLTAFGILVFLFAASMQP